MLGGKQREKERERGLGEVWAWGERGWPQTCLPRDLAKRKDCWPQGQWPEVWPACPCRPITCFSLPTTQWHGWGKKFVLAHGSSGPKSKACTRSKEFEGESRGGGVGTGLAPPPTLPASEISQSASSVNHRPMGVRGQSPSLSSNRRLNFNKGLGHPKGNAPTRTSWAPQNHSISGA